jgi:hypothetical protein
VAAPGLALLDHVVARPGGAVGVDEAGVERAAGGPAGSLAIVNMHLFAAAARVTLNGKPEPNWTMPLASVSQTWPPRIARSSLRVRVVEKRLMSE